MFAVLGTIKSAQLSHGLRFEDFQRYAQYCTRRLARLRKAAQFTTGKRYKAMPITEEDVANERFLLIPLMCAERAWGLAMHLRQENEDDAFPRKRHHATRRLAKAVQHCAQLNELCAARADKRTQMEAQAYGGMITAAYKLELEAFADALQAFVTAKTIYEQLAKIGGDAEMQQLYLDAVEQIDPQIELCKYQMKRRGEQADESLANAAAIKADLDQVMADSRQAEPAAAAASVEWMGKTIGVRNEKVRLALKHAQEMRTAIDAASASEEAKLKSFDALFKYYSEARSQVASELKGKSSDTKDTLRALDKYLQSKAARGMAERNLMLLATIESAWKAFHVTAGVLPTGDAPKAQDIVHLYDSLLQNMDVLADALEEDETQSLQLTADTLGYRALRCYYVARSYAASGQWSEAGGLCSRAAQLAEKAVAQQQASPAPNAVLIDQLQAMQQSAVAGESISVAQFHKAAAAADGDADSASAALAALNIDDGRTLLARMDDFAGTNSAGEPVLAEFPPQIQALPCKPILLDLAFDGVEYPPIGAVRKAAGGDAAAADDDDENEDAPEHEGEEKEQGGGWFGWMRR